MMTLRQSVIHTIELQEMSHLSYHPDPEHGQKHEEEQSP